MPVQPVLMPRRHQIFRYVMRIFSGFNTLFPRELSECLNLKQLFLYLVCSKKYSYFIKIILHMVVYSSQFKNLT